jgi:hypothetical protein
MSAVVLRRISIAHCFGLAWAIALGVPAAATASVLALPQGFEAAPYGTVRGNAASSGGEVVPASLASRRNRSKARYRSGDHNVAQISPTIRRPGGLSLEDGANPPCAAKVRRSSSCRAKSLRSKGLPDALLEAPSPATAKILNDIGIPAIKDVPPIAILRAGHPGVDENFTADLR